MVPSCLSRASRLATKLTSSKAGSPLFEQASMKAASSDAARSPSMYRPWAAAARASRHSLKMHGPSAYLREQRSRRRGVSGVAGVAGVGGG